MKQEIKEKYKEELKKFRSKYPDENLALLFSTSIRDKFTIPFVELCINDLFKDKIREITEEVEGYKNQQESRKRLLKSELDEECEKESEKLFLKRKIKQTDVYIKKFDSILSKLKKIEE
jgi:hypothetical protein